MATDIRYQYFFAFSKFTKTGFTPPLQAKNTVNKLALGTRNTFLEAKVHYQGTSITRHPRDE